MGASRANVSLQLRGEVLREEFQKTRVFDWFLRNGRIDLTDLTGKTRRVSMRFHNLSAIVKK